jgi:SAM-dependent methyltransferase
MLSGLFIHFVFKPGGAIPAFIIALLLSAACLMLWRQKYLFYLILLAVPTKLSIDKSGFRPSESFGQVHDRVLNPLVGRAERLQVLDVSTGSCNSLYKHGWMKLNAEYTAIDLSQTMLADGLTAMSDRGVAIDLIFGNALALPFQSEYFDVVLNYGAINGMTDPAIALAEMSRVAKPGALLLFLDEQMYRDATTVERIYFNKVLSSHNVIHRCPVEMLPPEWEDVRITQVYEFYYICSARKRAQP